MVKGILLGIRFKVVRIHLTARFLTYFLCSFYDKPWDSLMWDLAHNIWVISFHITLIAGLLRCIKVPEQHAKFRSDATILTYLMASRSQKISGWKLLNLFKWALPGSNFIKDYSFKWQFKFDGNFIMRCHEIATKFCTCHDRHVQNFVAITVLDLDECKVKLL